MINSSLLENLSILYVEDCAETQLTIKPFLEKFFKKVIFADDGMDALEKFKAEYKNGYAIDILLTDIVMPNMNGLELISSVRNLNMDIKVIISSSDTSESTFLRAFELNVNDYIVKPIDVGVLIKKIEQIVIDSKNNSLFMNSINKLVSTFTISKDQKVIYSNSFFLNLIEYSEEELTNLSFPLLLDSSFPKSLFTQLWKSINANEQWNGVLKFKTKSNEVFYLNTFILPNIEPLYHKKIIDFTFIGFHVTEQELERRKFKKNILLKMKDLNKEIYKLRQEKQLSLEDIKKEKLNNSSLLSQINTMTIDNSYLEDEFKKNRSKTKRAVEIYRKKRDRFKEKTRKVTELHEEEKQALLDEIEQLKIHNEQLQNHINSSIFNFKKIMYKNKANISIPFFKS